MGYIYKITNQLNQKVYIGQTTNVRPTDRFSRHKYLARHLDKDNSNSYLHKAMNKDGVDNFKFEVIEETENGYLNERECFWIKEYNSFSPNGYNLTLGGEGTPGFSRPQSEEERKQKGDAIRNYYNNNPEARLKASERAKKLWENEDYRRKVTESNINFYKEHPDLLSGENNPMYGKHHTEEALEKMREKAALRKIKIAQLDKETLEILQVYDGVRDAETALQVSHGWISKAAKQNKIAYGFRWKFL